MEEADQPVLISVLQHYAYCPRQFALIHVEQVWVENYFTVHGKVLHERGVAVKSQQLGLTGKLDLLEVEGKPPDKYFPVEYRRGKLKSGRLGQHSALCAGFV